VWRADDLGAAPRPVAADPDALAALVQQGLW
jgi:hypothetical protein